MKGFEIDGSEIKGFEIEDCEVDIFETGGSYQRIFLSLQTSV